MSVKSVSGKLVRAIVLTVGIVGGAHCASAQDLALPGQAGWKAAFASFSAATAAGVTIRDTDDKNYALASYAFGTIPAGRTLVAVVDITKDAASTSVAAARFTMDGKDEANCGIIPATGQILSWGSAKASFEDYKTFWRLTCRMAVVTSASGGELQIFPAISSKFGATEASAKGSINVARLSLVVNQ